MLRSGYLLRLLQRELLCPANPREYSAGLRSCQQELERAADRFGCVSHQGRQAGRPFGLEFWGDLPTIFVEEEDRADRADLRRLYEHFRFDRIGIEDDR